MLKRIHKIVSLARQHHGFQYEQKVIQKFNLQKAKGHTAPYDAHHKSLNIQIKCMQYGTSIEFGDYLRNKSKSSNFILVVGFWKDDKENIIQEQIFDVNVHAFTNNLYYPHDEDMFKEMRSISNLHEDDKKWKLFCQQHREQWREYKNSMDLRFRRDHKKQKRIQCGVSWKNYHYWFIEDMKQYSQDEFHHMLQS